MPPQRRERGKHRPDRVHEAGEGNDMTLVQFVRQVGRGANADGVLVVVPVGRGDEDAVEQLSFWASDHAQGRKSVSYLVGGIPGTPDYRIIDLMNLPPEVEVEVNISVRGVIHRSRWVGAEAALITETAELPQPDEQIPPGPEPTEPEPPAQEPPTDGPETSELRF